jgi:hypothetical protein
MPRLWAEPASAVRSAYNIRVDSEKRVKTTGGRKQIQTDWGLTQIDRSALKKRGEASLQCIA